MRRASWFLLAAALAATVLASCFSRPSSRCAFLCGTGGTCPEDYRCGSDDRCHLVQDNGDLAQCDDELFEPDAHPADASIDVISPAIDAGDSLDAM